MVWKRTTGWWSVPRPKILPWKAVTHVSSSRYQNTEEGVAETIKLEYITMSLTLFSLLLRALVMGNSTAMFATILEDITELMPPITILLTLYLEDRLPNPKHPYGYQRIGSLSFFAASMGLLALGFLAIWDGADELLRGADKNFGSATLFGRTFWQGWVMISVLMVTNVVMIPVFLVKRSLAKRVRLEALRTDSTTNLSHILVGMSAVVGLLLTRFGLGWADPLAAIVIGLAILWCGYQDMRAAVSELIDVSPDPPVMADLSHIVAAKPYVKGHYWLARKVGRFIDADLIVACHSATLEETSQWRQELSDELRRANWQLHDLTIAFGLDLPVAKDEDRAIFTWEKETKQPTGSA